MEPIPSHSLAAARKQLQTDAAIAAVVAESDIGQWQFQPRLLQPQPQQQHLLQSAARHREGLEELWRLYGDAVSGLGMSATELFERAVDDYQRTIVSVLRKLLK